MIHNMSVDYVDHEKRTTVFQCDKCARRFVIRGTDVEILAQGDLVDHRGGQGGLSIVGVEVT